MDLRQLECFLAVARHLHFGRAAEELRLAQPTVSESVRRLEHELGGKVFDRTSRQVRLTALGELFRTEALVAVETVTAAYRRGQAFAERAVTELHLGHAFTLSDAVLAAVAELQRRRPDVLVTSRSRSTARQLGMLREHRLDAACCVLPPDDPAFASMVIGRARLCAVLPHDHPAAAAGLVALADLAKEPLIAWPRTANPALYDTFAAAMDATGAPWTLIGTASGAENVAARVLAGFGVGVVFDSVAAARPIPGVAYVALGLGAPVVEQRLVWRADDANPAVALLVELVRAELATGPELSAAEQVELTADDVLR